MDTWRRVVWEQDAYGFPATIPELRRVARQPANADDRELLFALAWSCRFEDAAQAAATAARLREAHPGAPELGFFDAFAHRDAERPEEAVETLRAVLDRLRDDTDVPNSDEVRFVGHLLLGDWHVQDRKDDRVIEVLEEARLIARARGARLPRWAIRSLADAHSYMRQMPRAIELLEEAAAEDPGWAGHAYELARVYALQLEDARAAHWYRRTKELDPGFAPPYLALAVLASREGRLDDMRAELEAVREITTRQWSANPDSRQSPMAAEIRAGFGHYWMAIGHDAAAAADTERATEAYRRAAAHMEAALADNPLCARALVKLVQLGTILGTPEEQIAAWKSAMKELDPRVLQESVALGRGRTFC